MLLIQMTGLSGAGKSSIAHIARETLIDLGYKVELLDGDNYRQHLSRLRFLKRRPPGEYPPPWICRPYAG